MGFKLKAVVPSFRVLNHEFLPSQTHVHDSFSYLSLLFDDGVKTITRPFRFISDNGNFNQNIRLRGKDCDNFHCVGFPLIDGKSLRLPPIDTYIWSVTIKLNDGTIQVFDHPESVPDRFDNGIAEATITDALDNDWVAKA